MTPEADQEQGTWHRQPEGPSYPFCDCTDELHYSQNWLTLSRLNALEADRTLAVDLAAALARHVQVTGPLPGNRALLARAKAQGILREKETQ